MCSSDLLVHADVHQVIQFAEYAELRELRYACDEDELEVGVTVFQWGIEVAHHLAQVLKRILAHVKTSVAKRRQPNQRDGAYMIQKE